MARVTYYCSGWIISIIVKHERDRKDSFSPVDRNIYRSFSLLVEAVEVDPSRYASRKPRWDEYFSSASTIH